MARHDAAAQAQFPSTPDEAPGPPKIIHQFWDRPVPPPDVAERIQTWKDQHPGWAHILWSDESAESFIRSEFGVREARCFTACTIPAMRADVLRIAALLHVGGVYFDADMACLKLLTPLMSRPSTLFWRRREEKLVITNNALLTAPKHPLFEKMWSRVIATILSNPSTRHVSNLTGPAQLTSVWENELSAAEKTSVQLLPKKVLFDYVEPSRTLQYHREEGTWKDQARRTNGGLVDFQRRHGRTELTTVRRPTEAGDP